MSEIKKESDDFTSAPFKKEERIPEDTVKYVHCKICGKKFQVIFEGHLQLIHQISKEDYLKKFNLTEKNLASALMIKKLNDRKTDIQILKLHKVYMKLLKAHAGKLTEDIVKKSHGSFYFQLCYQFDTWDKAVLHFTRM